MIGFDRICPVLPVRNIDDALAHYRKLGFKAERYDEPIYGFISRGAIEFHVVLVRDLDPSKNTSAAYVYVSDANALYDEWTKEDVGGRLHPPQDTEYGLREFAHVDPDGNLLRVGSPLARA
jgi:catechol 2,3-dioxygenase-like lactoylglutathione lyase family enzyme